MSEPEFHDPFKEEDDILPSGGSGGDLFNDPYGSGRGGGGGSSLYQTLHNMPVGVQQVHVTVGGAGGGQATVPVEELKDQLSAYRTLAHVWDVIPHWLLRLMMGKESFTTMHNLMEGTDED